MLKKYYLIVFCFSTFFYSCNKNKDLLFESLEPSRTNVFFKNRLKSTTNFNILNYLYYYNGSGVSAADFNNDGLCDLYFTANQTEDALYINKGGFKFENSTSKSGITNSENWTTGSTVVDINNDGLLDIYVCKLGNYNNIKGKNLLFLNQGIQNGLPFFKECASKFGLDIQSFSTQSVFFDYDLDGDLDMFLLNHSLHPNSNYTNGKTRTKPDNSSGDKLFENINGYYQDITKTAGIYQGKIGYGLGLSVSDVNNDGYPDIYIGNDFFENDYLYINQKNKTFKEIISNDVYKLGHTSHFSMGNSMDDINNDGFIDIISLDMLPENIATYKTSGLEYPYQIYEYYLKNGYSPQFMQNTLHLNNSNNTFSEIAFLSGIAATDWSWSPSVADFDNDGFKDLYISNGILGATNDMDFVNFISNDNIQKQLGKKLTEKNLALSNLIPSKKVENYIFKNNGNLTFKNVTKHWSNSKPSYSNGSAFADLDNDGDLDLIVNNVNDYAFIIENKTEKQFSKNNFLKIKFKGSEFNKFGIGTKVIAYIKNQKIVSENFVTKGYLSSIEPQINLGLGLHKVIDSLIIIWPEGFKETLKATKTNQTIFVDVKNAKKQNQKIIEQKAFMQNVKPFFSFKHMDGVSVEFNREPLIPFASTNMGPTTSVGDIDNNGLDDVFIGGGKSQTAGLFLQQKNNQFKNVQQDLFLLDAKSEDTHSVFFDANSDGYLDLLVVSGGNEYKNTKELQPRLYINTKGVFKKETNQFQGFYINASKVAAIDIDNDGDLDISITSNLVPWQFGVTPKQYIFENKGNNTFKEYKSFYGLNFKNIGNVQDIKWVDIDNDNLQDAIVVGYWMPISIFKNNGRNLVLQNNTLLNESNGWWNTVEVADFDKDGDLDIIAGNWGLNTRLKASKNNPITLYNNDYDNNGTVDPVITYYHQNKETLFSSKDELAKQIPAINKKYLSYKKFADASLTNLLPKSIIDKTTKKQVFNLASCYFENIGANKFKKQKLPTLTQSSSVNDIVINDFNNDGYLDAFLVGNNYEINTQLGKLDASHGNLLLNNKQGFFTNIHIKEFDVYGPARHINTIKVGSENYYIITRNNNEPIFLKLNQ